MSRAHPTAMDDTGFIFAREPAPAAVDARAAGSGLFALARRAKPGKAGRTWAWAVGGAAVAHVLMLGPPMFARVTDPERFAPPPPVIYLDLTPAPRTPKARKPQPVAPSRAADARPEAPAPTPPAPPPPVVVRAAPAPAVPPPAVAPFQPPAQPAPRTEAAAPPAAAPAPARASAPSPEFQGKVLAALERVRRYPPAAKARREQGVVVLSFTMNRAGKVLGAQVQSSSGSATLDRAALETLRRASLPRVPDEFADPLRLTVPVEFVMK